MRHWLLLTVSFDLGVWCCGAGTIQVKEWQQQVIARAKKDGFTRTLMGRYRELPLINSPSAAARGHAARAAINTPIQGPLTARVLVHGISPWHGMGRRVVRLLCATIL